MSDAPKPHVIVVDSDAAVRDSICVLLQSHGIGTRAYASATAFLREVHPEQNSCIVVSVDLPGLNGLDLLAELYQRDIVIPAIITTNRKVTESLRSAADSVGATLLEKPYAVGELISNVRQALDRGSAGGAARDNCGRLS